MPLFSSPGTGTQQASRKPGGRPPQGKIFVRTRRPQDGAYARIHILHRPATACRPRPTRLRRGEPRLSRAQGDATLGSIPRTHGDPG